MYLKKLEVQNQASLQQQETPVQQQQGQAEGQADLSVLGGSQGNAPPSDVIHS